jgi:hypothetical protein
LVTCVGSEELAQVKTFAEDKLYSFAKEKDMCFSPDNFIPALKKCSEVGFPESQFAAKYNILTPFKVKIVKDEKSISQ